MDASFFGFYISPAAEKPVGVVWWLHESWTTYRQEGPVYLPLEKTTPRHRKETIISQSRKPSSVEEVANDSQSRYGHVHGFPILSAPEPSIFPDIQHSPIQ